MEQINYIKVNGKKFPIKGDSVFIRYSAYPDGADFTETWSEGQNYIGTASGITAPITKEGYTWAFFNCEVNKAYAHGAFSNALKGKVSGAIVAMDDVSPLEHNVAVKLSSKNLISSITARTNCTVSNGVVTQAEAQSDDIANFKLQYQRSNGQAVTPFIKAITELGKLSFSFNIEDSGITRITFGLNSRTKDTNVDFNPLPKGTYVFSCNITNLVQGSISWQDMQIEKGTEATPYTPYLSANTQVTVKKCGKNLIPYPYHETTKTENGITFKDNGDGTITVNGTATAEARFYLTGNKIPYVPLEPNTYYTVSGCPQGGGDDTYFLAYSGEPTGVIKDYGNGSSKKYDVLIANYHISIIVKSDTVCNNLVFKPQLELGTVATGNEPYTVCETKTTAIGKKVKIDSVAPNMTIYTDTVGACIECSYNRDINVVIGKVHPELAGYVEPEKLASFTLLGNGSVLSNHGTFTCEEGMTWAEFIESAYNDPDKLSISGDYVLAYGWGQIYGSNTVYPADDETRAGRPTEMLDVSASDAITYPYYYWMD